MSGDPLRIALARGRTLVLSAPGTGEAPGATLKVGYSEPFDVAWPDGHLVLPAGVVTFEAIRLAPAAEGEEPPGRPLAWTLRLDSLPTGCVVERDRPLTDVALDGERVVVKARAASSLFYGYRGRLVMVSHKPPEAT